MARLPLSAAALLALLASGPFPALAKGDPMWSFAAQGPGAQLTLGFPDGGEKVIELSCAPGSGTLAVRSFFGSNGLLPGEEAEVMLENNRARAAFPGKALADGMRVDVEGHGPLAKFEAMVRTNRPFVVAVKGARYITSQAGLGEPAAALVAACGNR